MVRPCHMLLVEPDYVLAEAATRIFAAHDVLVTVAPETRVALDLVAHVQFDCALIDVDLWEGINGVELARRIQQQRSKMRIALSTRQSTEEVDAPPGVVVFSKPYRSDAVVAALCARPAFDD